MFADLRELLEIRSEGGTPGEEQAQQWVAHKLQSWGWDVEIHLDDPADHTNHPDYPGMEVERTAVISVVGRPPGSNGSILLLGHTDVVPGGPPVTVTTDVVSGRGSVDMKSGVVAAMHAAKAVGGDVAVCTVSGEEDGGIGAFLALQHGLTAKRCLIPEPTDLALYPANAGSLTFRVTLSGVAAHGARRWEGRNALDGIPEILRRLRHLEAARSRTAPSVLASWPIAYPISIGRVEGGDWASTVMAQVHLEGRYGVALEESVDEAMLAFEDALAGTGAEVDWFGGRFASAGIDVDHPLVQDVAAAHAAVTGTPAQILGSTYGSDLRQLVHAGIPTVLYGPGDPVRAHSDSESVPVAQVEQFRAIVQHWLRA
jgi:acetylornithine deacetylase